MLRLTAILWNVILFSGNGFDSQIEGNGDCSQCGNCKWKWVMSRDDRSAGWEWMFVTVLDWVTSAAPHSRSILSHQECIFIQYPAQGLGIEPPTSQLVNTQLLLRSHSRLYRLKNHTHTHTHTHTHNTQQQPAAYMQRWEGSLTRWGWMAQAVHWCIMGHDWRASHLFILVRLVC